MSVFPSKCICWKSTPNVILLECGVFRMWLGHKGGALINENSVLLENPECSPLHEVLANEWSSVKKEVTSHQALSLPVCWVYASPTTKPWEINCYLIHQVYSACVTVIQTDKDSRHSNFQQAPPTQCISSKFISPFASSITQDRNLGVPRNLTHLQQINIESPLDCKEIQPVHSEGDQSWVFFGRNDAKAPVLWPPHVKSWLIGKDSDAGRDWGQEEKGTTEDEMAGWHHQFDGCESEGTPGAGDGQGGLACCDSWGCKESDMTQRLNWTELNIICSILLLIYMIFYYKSFFI